MSRRSARPCITRTQRSNVSWSISGRLVGAAIAVRRGSDQRRPCIAQQRRVKPICRIQTFRRASGSGRGIGCSLSTRPVLINLIDISKLSPIPLLASPSSRYQARTHDVPRLSAPKLPRISGHPVSGHPVSKRCRSQHTVVGNSVQEHNPVWITSPRIISPRITGSSHGLPLPQAACCTAIRNFATSPSGPPPVPSFLSPPPARRPLGDRSPLPHT